MPSGAGAPQLRVDAPGGFDALQHGVDQLGTAVDNIEKKMEDEQAKAQKEADQKAEDDGITAGSAKVTQVMHGSQTQRQVDEAFNAPAPQPAGDMGDPGAGPVDRNPDGGINLDALNKVLATPDHEAPHSAQQDPGAEGYTPNGYLELQGDTAVEHSVPTQQYLQKELKRIADVAPNERVKAALQHKFALMYDQAHQQIESHTSQQIEVAKQASANALLNTARTDVTLNPEDDNAAALAFAKGVDAATLGFKSAPDKAAREQAWHGQIAADRLSALIDKGDFKKADAVLNSNRQALGVKADAFEKVIQGHKDQAQAQVVAQTFVESSMSPDGTVDEAKLNKLLDTVAPEKRKLVDEVTKQAVVRAEHAVKQQKENIATGVFKQVNVKGFWGVPQAQRDALNQADPVLYDRLKNEADRQFRERHATDHEAQRLQNERNRDALEVYKKQADGDPAGRAKVDLDHMLAGLGVDGPGRHIIEAHQAADKQTVAKGNADKEPAFVQQAVDAILPGKARTKENGAQFEGVKTMARDAFLKFQAEHEGKLPDPAQAKAIIDGMVQKKAQGGVTVFGHTFFQSEKPQYEIDLEAKKKGEKPVAQDTPPIPAEVEVHSPGGKRYGMSPDAAAAWLKTHPTWSK